MKMKIYSLAAFLVFCLNMPGISQIVIPDSTFNGTARNVFSLGGTNDYGDNVAVQPDGKILMSGATFMGGQAKLGMVRMNPDGSFDPAFGTSGISIIDLGPLGYNGGFEPEIIIRPDGKILVCGFCKENNNDDMFVCRLTTTGLLDNTFGTGGRVAVDLLGTNSAPDAAYAITADASGNIYACGSTRTGGDPFSNDVAIIKLTSAGVLDPSFSGDGKLILDISGSWDFGYGIAVQIDNKIVVTGYAGLPADFFAARLNPDGSYDPTYGSGGKVTIDIFGTNAADESWGMRMGPDEKVYLVGDGYNSAVGEFQSAVVRLTTSGIPDPAFSADGIATFDIWPGNTEIPKDIIVLPNGKCLVGGSVGSSSQDFSVFRINADGSLDLTFNNTGYYTVDVTGTTKNDLGYGMALQSDGKILLSGNTSIVNAVDEYYSIMRLIPNGVVANFTASANLVCEGSTVQYTSTSAGENLSYLWTFEGGAPSASTLANPLVTYASAGIYDVKLKVYNSEFADSLLISNMIEVIAIPGTPASPSGPSSFCNQQAGQYSTNAVPFATSYTWQVNPATAGVLSSNGTSATFTASSTYTGSFSISVQASNQCGPGSWSEATNGTIYKLPEVFTFSGNGDYCEGTAGATLTLSGSETGVDYQLHIDGIASGAVLPGTGSALSWTNLTTMGFYIVKALTPNCSNDMAGQIYVSAVTVPAQPATPAGPLTSCGNEVAVYTVSGTAAGNVLVWTLTPTSAGTMSPSGASVSIVWAAGFTGSASLSVQAQNDCGNSPQSGELAVIVNAVPAPVISGLQTVCEAWSSDYQTPGNSGSTYAWNVTGGTIVNGAGTNVITVLWGQTGNGSISVTETSNALCSGASQVFNVLVDPCTGIESQRTSESIHLFPNPVKDILTINFDSGITVDLVLMIVDAMGRTVLEKDIPAGGDSICTIDMSGFPGGYYSLLAMEKGKIVKKMKILKQ
jgi:uncharacterized delta-60 repeat protein